jgi:phospholipid-transporting ATPase
MTRLFQGRFMMWDHKMRIFQPQPNGKLRKMRMQANNTNLNEELGRVDYVLSDKTGTLTQNNMKSSKWYIDGKIYDEMAEPGCLLNALRSESNPKIALFTHTLSLCHSVIPALDEVTHQLVYESQSPDETALLNSMRNNGSKLVSRIKGFLSVEFLYPRSGQVQDPIVEQHLQLAVLEFSSDRKRMSLIARAPNGKIYLYSKGADNIMLARLKKDAHSQDMINHINSALYDFSVIGLRTLVVAYREFTEEEWKFHADRLEQAEKSLTNREGKIAAVAEEIERDLIFVGCTAIEDRLQEQVPETIDFMLQVSFIWHINGLDGY